MQNFNKAQDGHLAAITPIPTVLAGIYPGSKNDLSKVEDGDVVAVPMMLQIQLVLITF